MHAFNENPNRVHTELTFINPQSAITNVFCRPLKYLKPHRQTVWTQIRLLPEQSDLGPQCLTLCLC